MFPVIFEVGPLILPTYGLMAAMGLFLGSFLFVRRASIEGEDPQKAMDLLFFVVIGGIVGSRFLHVIIEYKAYVNKPLEIFMFWKGGLVWYGGLILAMILVSWYVKKHKLHPWKIADMTAPSFAIGHAFGRLGCLFAGCCHGRFTDSWLGIVFTDPRSLAPLNVSLYPTQIFSSINEFVIFFILITVRPYKIFHGQLFLLWIMLYAPGRFAIEFLRGDPRGYLGPLSTSQWIAIGAFTIAAFMFQRSFFASREQEAR